MDEGKRIATLQLPSLKGWTFAGQPATSTTTGRRISSGRNGAGVVGEWLMRDFGRAATMELAGHEGLGSDCDRRLQWRRHGRRAVATSGKRYASHLDDGRRQSRPTRSISEKRPAPELLGVGDIDGNGKADLLWRHLATSNVHAWTHLNEVIRRPRSRQNWSACVGTGRMIISTPGTYTLTGDLARIDHDHREQCDARPEWAHHPRLRVRHRHFFDALECYRPQW